MLQGTPFILEPANILLGLDATTPEEAVHALVGALGESVDSNRKKQLVTLVLAREEEASTCLGKGTALPHARTSLVNRLSVSAALLKTPVTWDASGKTVNLLFLMAIPKTAIEEYLLAIRTLTHAFKTPGAVERLCAAKDAEGFLATLGREIEAGAQYKA